MPRSRVPEIPDGLQWFNVDSPVSLPAQAGRVLLLYFGNYSSLRCLQVHSDLGYLADKYRERLVIVGIHSPQFAAERGADHLQKAINRHQVYYPLVNDPGLAVSNAYGIREWPAQVLVDPEGYILGSLTGDGHLAKLDHLIEYQLGRHGGESVVIADPVSIFRVPEPANVLSFPGKIVASDSKIYIADSGNNRILVASRNGGVLRQYGGGVAGLIDGDGTSAAFNNPQGMVLDDQYLYVADAGNHAIRRIHTRNNDVVTVAGTGKQGASRSFDGSNPLRVDLNYPCDLACRRGSLYIAMTGLHQVWRFSLIENRLEIFSGSGDENLVDGRPALAAFAQPSGLAILRERLYIADAGSSAVRSVDLATGYVQTLAGGGMQEYGDTDGQASAARFQYPQGIAADPGRNRLWLADTYNNKIRMISINSDTVSSMDARHPLHQPGGLAFQDGTLYIANTNLHEILRLDPESGHAEALNVTEEFAEI